MRRAALAFAAAALTACGGPPAPTAPTGPTAPPGPTTITYTAPVPMPAATTPAEKSWTMPDLVGSDLQDAQDSIQRITGYGIAITTSHDATGAGRMQVADRNWRVCSQNVPPGETITPSSRIDFGVVKLDESC
jgi:PASTA domain-containing protein